MAITTTLLDYRTRFYSRFDEGQSQYIQAAEANILINEARAHLHNWIIVSNEDYLVNEFSWQFVANQSDYKLPGDYFKDLKVFGYYSDGTDPATYWPIPRRMRGEYRGGSSTLFRYGSTSTPFPCGYMVLGQVLRIDPAPAAATGTGIKMWYAPHYQPLLNDTDTESVFVVPGWDEYVVNQAVISAKMKEESDVSVLMARQGEIKALIEQDMMNRDMGQPQHVLDVSRDNMALGGWRGW